MMVLIDAINRAGSTDPDKIQAALAATNMPPEQLIVPYKGVKFDQNGQKLNSPTVDYRDGTHAPTNPPTPLPPMTDHCDLVMRIDNRYPDVDLQIPAAAGDCGVVSWNDAATLTINANVNQAHNRLYYWALSYIKGTTGISHSLASDSDGAGLATPVNQSVPLELVVFPIRASSRRSVPPNWL